MNRRVKWLVAAFMGLGALAAAGIAGALTLSRDPASLVLFDVRLTKTANLFLRDNGVNYSFWRHGPGLRDNVYYADQFENTMLGSAEYSDRVFRYRVLHDWKGDPYFSSSHELGFKDDDHALHGLGGALRRIESYRSKVEKGEAVEPPRDLAAYKLDGITQHTVITLPFDTCDPLASYQTLSVAVIDDDLNRHNETHHDRTLVLLGEFPMKSGGYVLTERRCPRFTDWLGSHSTKANAHAFGFTRLDKEYLLTVGSFPLSFIVKSPLRDFCTAISYRDAYGTHRTLYAIYTSPDRLVSMLGEVRPDREWRSLTRDEYSQRNEARYRKLMNAIPRLDCTDIRK